MIVLLDLYCNTLHFKTFCVSSDIKKWRVDTYHGLKTIKKFKSSALEVVLVTYERWPLTRGFNYICLQTDIVNLHIAFACIMMNFFLFTFYIFNIM